MQEFVQKKFNAALEIPCHQLAISPFWEHVGCFHFSVGPEGLGSAKLLRTRSDERSRMLIEVSE